MSSGSEHPGQVMEQLAGGRQVRDVVLIQKYEPHSPRASLGTANDDPVSKHQPIRSRALEAGERFLGCVHDWLVVVSRMWRGSAVTSGSVRNRLVANENPFVMASRRWAGSKPRLSWPGSKSMTKAPITPFGPARGMVHDHGGASACPSARQQGNVERGGASLMTRWMLRLHSGFNCISTLWQSSKATVAISSSHASPKLSASISVSRRRRRLTLLAIVRRSG